MSDKPEYEPTSEDFDRWSDEESRDMKMRQWALEVSLKRGCNLDEALRSAAKIWEFVKGGAFPDDPADTPMLTRSSTGRMQ